MGVCLCVCIAGAFVCATHEGVLCFSKDPSGLMALWTVDVRHDQKMSHKQHRRYHFTAFFSQVAQCGEMRAKTSLLKCQRAAHFLSKENKGGIEIIMMLEDNSKASAKKYPDNG